MDVLLRENRWTRRVKDGAYALSLLGAISCAERRYEVGHREAASTGSGGGAADGSAGGGSASAAGGVTAAGGGASDAAWVPTFGPARLLTEVADGEHAMTDPTVTADALELYFSSARWGNKDIFRVRRASTTEPWGVLERPEELRTVQTEASPRVSSDGLRIVFFSDRDRSAGTFWEAHRAHRDAAWSTPTRLTVPGTETDSSVACDLDGSGLQMVFTSNRPALGKLYSLYEASRSSLAEPFDEPVPIVELNTERNEYDPYLSPDGLLVGFHSDRDGSDDLFLTRRPSVSEAFAAPQPIATLNTTAYQEFALAITPDLRYAVFCSDRDGVWNLYEARAVP